jgi:aminoglycoside phosphotransferase (APT) family kinase protein
MLLRHKLRLREIAQAPLRGGMADMSEQVQASLADKLDALLTRLRLGSLGRTSLKRLTGGANQETWAFDAINGTDATSLILRRLSGEGLPSKDTVTPECEANLIRRVGECGVPTASVRHILEPGEDLGRGFISTRIEGEALPRRILRGAIFADLRPRLAFQCGAILARIHAVPLGKLPRLRVRFAAEQIDELYENYRSFGGGSPAYEVAFRWLRARLPGERSAPRLLHGDFRNGNLIVGPEGVRAVLDWELAHFGDPAQDLGWITVNSWRYGVTDKAVGGFGTVEQLLAGYRAEGGEAIDIERVLYWRAFGSLRWGLMSRSMARAAQAGMPIPVERAMIGRRFSETELDLLDILAPEERR